MAKKKRERNYTIEEVAEIKCCSVPTAYRHAKRWGGKREAGERRWLFSPTVVERMLHGSQATR